MKLFKTLPLLTVIPACIPFIASCSAMKYDASYNLLSESSLKTKQLDESSIPTEDKITNFYFQKIYKNHQILFDDIAFSLKRSLFVENTFDAFTVDINLADNPNVNNHKLSLTIHVEQTLKADHSQMIIDLSLKNMVTEVIKDGSCWIVQPNFFTKKAESIDTAISLIKNNKSEINSTYKQILNNGEKTLIDSYSLNYQNISESNIDVWDQEYQEAILTSWYFNKGNL